MDSAKSKFQKPYYTDLRLDRLLADQRNQLAAEKKVPQILPQKLLQ